MHTKMMTINTESPSFIQVTWFFFIFIKSVYLHIYLFIYTFIYSFIYTFIYTFFFTFFIFTFFI